MFDGVLNTPLVSLWFSTSTKSITKTSLVNCGPNCFYTIFQYSKNAYDGFSREHYTMLMNLKIALYFFLLFNVQCVKNVMKAFQPISCPLVSLYISPQNHEKPSDFLIFSRGVERKKWLKRLIIFHDVLGTWPQRKFLLQF